MSKHKVKHSYRLIGMKWYMPEFFTVQTEGNTMSKHGVKAKVTPLQRNVAQWHREKAIRFWMQGKWDEYTRHIRIADGLCRR